MQLAGAPPIRLSAFECVGTYIDALLTKKEKILVLILVFLNVKINE